MSVSEVAPTQDLLKDALPTELPRRGNTLPNIVLKLLEKERNGAIVIRDNSGLKMYRAEKYSQIYHSWTTTRTVMRQPRPFC